MKNILVILAITATLVASAQVPNYVPTNGLVGWWGFNGNANDQTTNTNDGVVYGATLATDRFGNPNSTYDFDGSDYIEIPPNNSLIGPTNAITLSAWILSNGGSGLRAIFTHRDTMPTNATNIYGLWVSTTNSLYAEASGQSSISPIQLNNGAISNNWHHAVLVIDDVFLHQKIYLDGVLLETSNNALGLIDLTNKLARIGRHRDSFNNWQYFNGKIDDIGIWNRALTQCEIQDLYNAQLNSVDVSAGNDLTVCEGDEIVLSASGADSYSWNNGVLDSIPFVATNTSEYVVVGTDTLGCLGTDTMQVNVLSTSSSSQNETSLDSYVWSVNGQTYTQSGTYTDTLLNVLGCDSIVTLNLDLNFTGIESDNNNEFNVFPNPVNELLTIINTSNASKKITLIDKQGRLVLESIISKEKNTINLAHLESGNYLLFIEGNDSPIQIIKK